MVSLTNKSRWVQQSVKLVVGLDMYIVPSSTGRIMHPSCELHGLPDHTRPFLRTRSTFVSAIMNLGTEWVCTRLGEIKFHPDISSLCDFFPILNQSRCPKWILRTGHKYKVLTSDPSGVVRSCRWCLIRS